MKEIQKTVVGIIIVLLSFPYVYSQNSEFKTAANREKIISEFYAKQQTVKTLSCTFQQTKFISYLSARIESNGKFFYKSENSIRWEYLQPYQYAIIMNDGKLKIDGNNNDIQYKIRENKYIEKVNDVIQDSFCGDIFSNDNYNAELEENPTQFRLKLIPKKDEIKSFISIVYLHFDKKTLSILSISFHEPSKDVTSIVFSDQVFNQTLDSNLFK